MFTPNLGRTLTAAGISRLGVGRIEADRDLPPAQNRTCTMVLRSSGDTDRLQGQALSGP